MLLPMLHVQLNMGFMTEGLDLSMCAQGRASGKLHSRWQSSEGRLSSNWRRLRSA